MIIPMNSQPHPPNIHFCCYPLSSESWELFGECKALRFKISTMQEPKQAAEDHSTSNPTKSSPSSSPSPPHQRSPSPTVDLNPITQNTVVTGGGEVEVIGEGGSSEVVAVGAGSSVDKGSMTVSAKRKWELRETPRGPPKCPVCALEFPSWKSVFGHLRKHPDRAYRGLFPPPSVELLRTLDESLQYDVEAGKEIDLNLEPMEGVEVKKEANEETPMEGVEYQTSDAAEKKSELEEKPKENAMEGVGESCEGELGKSESSETEKPMEVKEEVKEEKEEVAPMEGVESTFEAEQALKNEIVEAAGSSSSSPSSANNKKAFAFDLNELPPDEEDEEEDNVP